MSGHVRGIMVGFGKRDNPCEGGLLGRKARTGHPCGDEFVREVGRLTDARTRNYDFIGLDAIENRKYQTRIMSAEIESLA